MTDYVYAWSDGAPVSGLKAIDPNEFAVALTKIEESHGQVTGPILAEVAKDPEHIAHNFIYHVGRNKAAALHYAERARLLIRLHVVMVVDQPDVRVRARIAVSADSDDGGSGQDRYLPAQEVASRPDLRDLHRLSLLRRMNLLRQELVRFDEFADVVREMDKVLRKTA